MSESPEIPPKRRDHHMGSITMVVIQTSDPAMEKARRAYR